MKSVLTRWRNERRQRACQAQLGMTVQMLSQCVGAGLNMPQAIEHSARHLPSPMRESLQLVVDDMALGRSLVQAMGAWRSRVGGEVAEHIYFAMQVLHESGGNIAETLRDIVAHVQAQEAVKQKLRTYTAPGIVSACIIGALPFVMGAAIACWKPEAVQIFFVHPIGLLILMAALVLQTVGIVWVRKLLQIRV